MKKIYSTILPIVMILCLAMLSSCSGNSDETENGGTDDGILRITADKTAIQADGVEKVTFTVKLGTKDVSEESTMNLILVKESGEENLDYGVRAFSTSVRVRMSLKPAIMKEKQWSVKMKCPFRLLPYQEEPAIIINYWGCSLLLSGARPVRRLALH